MALGISHSHSLLIQRIKQLNQTSMSHTSTENKCGIVLHLSTSFQYGIAPMIYNQVLMIEKITSLSMHYFLGNNLSRVF